MRYVTLLLLLVGCSSQRFEKMTSVDSVLEDYESSNHKTDDQFITRRGSVVSMHLEEVRDQKAALERKLDERDKKIEYLNSVLSDLHREMMQLRIRSGLPAIKPVAQGTIGPNGYLIPGSFKDSPTLDEEFTQRGISR